MEMPYKAINQVIVQLAKDNNVSQEAIVIAWLLCRRAGIQPILGTKNPLRIKITCEATKVSLTREQWYGCIMQC